MRINEVERLVGVTKGNIRFYEKEGLLTPRRNSENGYRDYNETDVDWLKKIKLLRMLDIPIEDILHLKAGQLTLEETMDRHTAQLERRRADLEAMSALCGQLRESRMGLEELDVDEVLSGMVRQEQEGTKFMNIRRVDRVKRYVSPVVCAVLILLMMGWCIGVMVWGFSISPEEAPPLGVLIVLIAIPVAVIWGVLAALYQRMKQIQGGEEDAAAKY